MGVPHPSMPSFQGSNSEMSELRTQTVTFHFSCGTPWQVDKAKYENVTAKDLVKFRATAGNHLRSHIEMRRNYLAKYHLAKAGVG